jgi:hypothetical protein
LKYGLAHILDVELIFEHGFCHRGDDAGPILSQNGYDDLIHGFVFCV